jgi:uncharacterized protein YkwD
VGGFVISRLGIQEKWQDAVGYILIVFVVQIIVSQIFIFILNKSLKRFIPYRLDTILGSLFAVANTLISVTLILLLIEVLPVPVPWKNTVRSSEISNKLFILADKYAKPLRNSVEDAAQQAANFITVRPDSKEIKVLDVNIDSRDLTFDDTSEKEMLETVNVERIKRGIVGLSSDQTLTIIARDHSRDMLIRKYFSHVTPDGKTLKDRLAVFSVQYSAAAENLAFAPTVQIAHTGLMASEDHKKNILDPSFSKIGIGIIDAGIYGKMFTQVFTDEPFLFKHYP